MRQLVVFKHACIVYVCVCVTMAAMNEEEAAAAAEAVEGRVRR